MSESFIFTKLTYQKQFSYGDVEWEKFTTFFQSEILVTPPTIFQSYHLCFYVFCNAKSPSTFYFKLDACKYCGYE